MHIREILTDTWHHGTSQSLSEFGETRIAEMPNIKIHRKQNMLCFMLIQKPFSENTIQRSVLVNDKRTLKTWVSVCLFICDQRKPCWKCWTMAVWWRFVAPSLSTIHVQRSVWVFGTCSKLWRSDWELKAAILWITGVYHGLPEKWESTKNNS